MRVLWSSWPCDLPLFTLVRIVSSDGIAWGLVNELEGTKSQALESFKLQQSKLQLLFFNLQIE